MQVIAADSIRPKEAIEYLSKFPKIELFCFVLFCASSNGHIQETKDLVEQKCK
jgi:hypothetical protein